MAGRAGSIRMRYAPKVRSEPDDSLRPRPPSVLETSEVDSRRHSMPRGVTALPDRDIRANRSVIIRQLGDNPTVRVRDRESDPTWARNAVPDERHRTERIRSYGVEAQLLEGGRVHPGRLDAERRDANGGEAVEAAVRRMRSRDGPVGAGRRVRLARRLEVARLTVPEAPGPRGARFIADECGSGAERDGHGRSAPSDV